MQDAILRHFQLPELFRGLPILWDLLPALACASSASTPWMLGAVGLLRDWHRGSSRTWVSLMVKSGVWQQAEAVLCSCQLLVAACGSLSEAGCHASGSLVEVALT